MNIARRVVRAATPKSLRELLRSQHRAYVFRRKMTRAAADPDSLGKFTARDYSELSYGWGNEGWSASSEYLAACLGAVRSERGPILECGAGLSTLLLGIVAKRVGTTLWSLEHDPGWAVRMNGCLEQFSIDSVRLCLSPLRDYEQFHWYDAPMSTLPADFGLVICDGPPGDTRGGRMGMLAVMRPRLRPGCLILLDDAERAAERLIAEEWARELGATVTVRGDERPFIELRVPEGSGR